MNNKDDGSPINIPRNIKYYKIPELQPEEATSRSSESDLMSFKIKKAIIVYYNSITILIIYNICLNNNDTIYLYLQSIYITTIVYAL